MFYWASQRNNIKQDMLSTSEFFFLTVMKAKVLLLLTRRLNVIYVNSVKLTVNDDTTRWRRINTVVSSCQPLKDRYWTVMSTRRHRYTSGSQRASVSREASGDTWMSWLPGPWEPPRTHPAVRGRNDTPADRSAVLSGSSDTKNSWQHMLRYRAVH